LSELFVIAGTKSFVDTGAVEAATDSPLPVSLPPTIVARLSPSPFVEQ
jgi:hypothetical protein